MSDLSYLFSPNSQFYNARQNMINDDLTNTGKDLQNQTLQADLPGRVGNSMSLMAKGQVDQAGVQDKIDQNHSDVLTKLDENQLKQLGAFGEKLSMVGGQLEQVPAMYRQQVFTELAPKFGLDTENPVIKMAMSQSDPESFSKVLSAMGTGISQNTAKAIEKRAEEQAHYKQATDVAKIGVDGRIATTETTAAARMAAADTAAQASIQKEQIRTQTAIALADKKAATLLQTMKPEQRWVYLNKLAPEERTPTEQAEFERLTQHSYNLKALGTPSLAPELINGDQPSSPLGRAGKAADGITQPKAPGPAPAPIDPAKIKDAGYEYEPSKYEYAIINGKVMRRAKQR